MIDAHEDGRPPSVLTTIVIPHITHLGKMVLILGFESPNLCFAGLVRQAYEMCKPLDLPPERIWQPSDDRIYGFDEMPKQYVVLT